MNDMPILVEADGEMAGHVPVSFELLDQSLHLIV
jgi:diacylglycerol kinase family enzyme